MIDLKVSSLCVLKLMDLIILNDDDINEKVIVLCYQVKMLVGNIVVVCIYLCFILIVCKMLNEQGMLDICIVMVINFLYGNDDIDIVLVEICVVIVYGVDEVDVVFLYCVLIVGNEQVGFELVKVCKEVCVVVNVLLKVIIEIGELKEEVLICKVFEIFIKVGVDFIKILIGKVLVNVMLESVCIMMEVICDMGVEKIVGFKLVGGVCSVEDVQQFLVIVDELFGVDWVDFCYYCFGVFSLLVSLLKVLGYGDGKSVSSY